jgi:hypothetical protein
VAETGVLVQDCMTASYSPANTPVTAGRRPRTHQVPREMDRQATPRPDVAVRALTQAGCHIKISRVEFAPSRPRVAALASGEVGGKIFEVNLVSGSVRGDVVQR